MKQAMNNGEWQYDHHCSYIFIQLISMAEIFTIKFYISQVSKNVKIPVKTDFFKNFLFMMDITISTNKTTPSTARTLVNSRFHLSALVGVVKLQ